MIDFHSFLENKTIDQIVHYLFSSNKINIDYVNNLVRQGFLSPEFFNKLDTSDIIKLVQAGFDITYLPSNIKEKLSDIYASQLDDDSLFTNNSNKNALILTIFPGHQDAHIVKMCNSIGIHTLQELSELPIDKFKKAAEKYRLRGLDIPRIKQELKKVRLSLQGDTTGTSVYSKQQIDPEDATLARDTARKKREIERWERKLQHGRNRSWKSYRDRQGKLKLGGG